MFKYIHGVTGIQLNTESLNLQVGDSFIVTPVILPEDASNKNVIYTSEDKQICEVDSLGKIYAISVGDTKITVKTEDGGITKEIIIKVTEKLNEDEITFDESLRVVGNEISRWDIENLIVRYVKQKIDTKYIIKIYDNKDKQLADDEIIGTGSKIRIVDEQDIIKAEYNVIIYGDVNGDGKINTVDLLVLQRHILEIEFLNGSFLKAGNINKNGKNPSSLDSLLIQRHILKLKLIEQ